MNIAFEEFQHNITRVRNLGGLYLALTKLTTPVVDASDILRAQLVLAVSGLDYYIHQLTLIGMTQSFEGSRPKTPSFMNFRVPMESVTEALNSHDSAWFIDHVRDYCSYQSYQRPEKISEAIHLFSDVNIWPEVSVKLAITEQAVKNTLTLIIDRRNKIAHEADMNPTYPGERWPITKPDVDQAIDFIDKLSSAIHECVV
jgi:hypothetical protein